MNHNKAAAWAALTASKHLPTDKICELYRSGKTIKQIAAAHNCSHNSVRFHLRKGSVSPKPRSRHRVCSNVAITKEPIMKKKNSNRQRDIINYVLTSIEEVFTIESVAKQFDCTVAEASRTLSSIAKKGLGLVRSIRGTYKKSNSVKKTVVTVPKQTTFPFDSPLREKFPGEYTDDQRAVIALMEANIVSGKVRLEDNILSLEDNIVSHNGKATWPKYNPKSSVDYIQICQDIISLSERCGGIDILIERASDLKKQGYGK